MFRGFVVAAGCALVVANIAIAETPAVTADRVRIHHVSVLTGVSAGANKEGLASAMLYIDHVNKGGGVAGRQIEVVQVDDKADAKVTEQIAQDLVGKNEVLSFFLPRTSPSTQALLKVTEGAGVPVVGPQPGPDFLYETDQRTVFTVRASFGAEVRRAIELQSRLGRQTFAVLAANDAFGNPLVEVASRKLKELGLKAPIVEKVNNLNPNIASALESFSKAKPDVVFLLCAPGCASDFVNQYVQRGVFTQFIAISNNSSNAFIKPLGGNARGVVVMQVAPMPSSRTIALSKEYSAACAAAKIEPSYVGIVGYVAAKVLVEGLRRAGKNLSPTSLRTSLASIRSHDLGGFEISYGPNDRTGTDFVDETIISRDGKFLR